MTAPELARTPDGRIAYQIDAGTQLAAFFMSTARVQGIQGPVGSGKSKICNMKVWKIASEQRPMRDGIRRTRWGVVRDTYPELKTTTIRTWEDTFPQNEFGNIKWSMPISQVMRMGDVECQIDFLALDKVDDVKKIRSGEYTGFYINEAQYTIKELFDEMTSRAGRYPAMKDGGPTWYGVIFDMNAPDEDHFIAQMTGQVEWPENMPQEDRDSMVWPAEWDFFMQPPGMLESSNADGTIRYTTNPHAENLKWLPPGYYENQIKGKSRAFIKSRILNKIALVVEGSPVYPNFRPEFHVAREALLPVRGHEVIVGIDPGRWPAAICAQEIGSKVYVQYELMGFNEPATTWAPKLKRFLEHRYPGYRIRFVGDPKGFDKGQATDDSAYDVFGHNDMKVMAAPVKMNNIETRIGAVSHILDDNPSGIARIQVSPVCRTLKVGLEGKYFMEKDETGVAKPCKNRYSHPCNALEYLLLGLGEGRRMVGIEPAQFVQATRVAMPRRSLRRVSA